MNRPKPPSASDLLLTGGFIPDRELGEWAVETFVEQGTPLSNPEHEHLRWGARIGCLWTATEYERKGRRVVGMAEEPDFRVNAWHRGRQEQQLRQWFHWLEDLPDFVLTFNASWSRHADDPSWCALVEHELYHCAQATDRHGAPAFDRAGRPKYEIRGHDVGEFVGVVRRYGAEAAGPEVARMVEAASRQPEVSRAEIAGSCGTCLKAA